MADEDEIDNAEEAADGATDADKTAAPPKPSTNRDDELVNDPDIEDALGDLYADVQQGYQDQIDRVNLQIDYWDIYNCELGPNQVYAGNSQIFVPIVHSAIEARKTRFVNQMFPPSGRYIEVVSSDAKPQALMSLGEHYIRAAKLRTEVMPALMRSGDVEGQYNCYVSWEHFERNVIFKVKRKPEAAPGEVTPEDVEEIEDIEEDTIVDAGPRVEVLADADVCVLPQTAASVMEAVLSGGSATVIRRWSKSKIMQMIEDEEIDEEQGKSLLASLETVGSDNQPENLRRNQLYAAGIHTETDGSCYALVYETWAMLKVEGKRQICRIYFGGADAPLSCKRNPYWSDRVPLFSVAQSKLAGVFKGQSKLKHVAQMQYAANDAVNEGMDSAAYALMPIIMTDPEKNPRVGSMVLNLAAIWETSPKDTQFAQFPELWKQAFEIVAACKRECFQVLSTSPAMLTQNSGELSQGEIAAEQQIDILSTADAVTTIEEGILTPMISFFMELDHQFREDDLTVRQYGNLGLEIEMERIPPIQMNKRYEFRWFGVESARNVQQIQQQIATMNVVRGIPPQQYPGYEINLVPIITQLVENTFGPRLAPQIFKDMTRQLTMDPERETELLLQTIDLPVHPLDNDQEHLMVHLQALQQFGDTSGALRTHMMAHEQQMRMKIQQQMMAQAAAMMGGQPGGMPGVPGGAGPGVPGTPRPGAQPGQPRGGQAPPGAIHQDQIQDPGRMPRPQRGPMT